MNIDSPNTCLIAFEEWATKERLELEVLDEPGDERRYQFLDTELAWAAWRDAWNIRCTPLPDREKQQEYRMSIDDATLPSFEADLARGARAICAADNYRRYSPDQYMVHAEACARAWGLFTREKKNGNI